MPPTAGGVGGWWRGRSGEGADGGGWRASGAGAVVEGDAGAGDEGCNIMFADAD